MKILYISDSTLPSFSANSIQVAKMCSAMASLGHEVSLLGKKTRAITHDKDITGFYGVKDNFTIRSFPKKDFAGSGRLYNLLLPFFQPGGVDLIYTRAIYPAFWNSLLGKKFVFEIHEPFETKSPWLAFIFSIVIKRNCVSKWVVITNALKKHLIKEHGIAEKDIVVAYDGADETTGDITPKSLTGSFKVGYAGSLLTGKGAELIIPIAQQMPAVAFHIVGGTEEQINKLKQEGVSSNVIFYGQVKPEEVKEYLAAFDIVLAPYQNTILVKQSGRANNLADWMSPLKIFEYMTAKKPVIASSLPVLKEVLKDGYNALLCESTDVIEWVKAINRLKEDASLRDTLSTTAYEDFKNNYTWEKRCKLILSSL